MSYYWNHMDGTLFLFFWKLIICCLFTRKMCTQKYFTPVQISDHFGFKHGRTKSYKIICLINHYNVWCNYPTILWFQVGPHLPKEHKDTQETHYVIINDKWEENSTRLRQPSNFYNSVSDTFRKKKLTLRMKVQGAIKRGELSSH
jgi:hypothetical protein